MAGIPSLISGAVLLLFGFIQAVALVMLIIIRYHFREFLPANDLKGKTILLVMSLGIFAFLITSAIGAYFIVHH